MRRLGALAALLALCGPLARPARAASTDTLAICDDVKAPPSLDPQGEFDNKSDDILFQIFEGLYRVGAGGTLEPALATGCRWLDPLTLRCRLRPGVAFHNGDPLDAQAVKWSILRAIDPKTGFIGANELANIAAVDAPDASTVDIRTKKPDGLLLRRLASFVKIASPRYYAQAGPAKFAAEPVGTGPFRFVREEAGRALYLAANGEYWDRGRPRVRNVVFRFVPPEEQVPLLLSGGLDAITEVPPAETFTIAESSRARIVKRSVLATPAFWFTSFTGPLKDRRVRRALNLAVDKDILIRYASRGNGTKIATLSMPGETGHDESLRPYPYSPERARKALAEAGYPKGFPLSLLVSPQAAREAGIIAAQWGDIGVRTKVTVAPMGEIVARLFAPKARRFAYDVVGNLAPDPAAHVYFLAGICFFSGSPFGRLNDPEFDALYADISAALDPSQQLAAAKKLDALIYREAWGVFTYQKIQTYAVNRDLVMPLPQTGVMDLRDAHWKR